jgi:hypothetical protein
VGRIRDFWDCRGSIWAAKKVQVHYYWVYGTGWEIQVFQHNLQCKMSFVFHRKLCWKTRISQPVWMVLVGFQVLNLDFWWRTCISAMCNDILMIPP